MTMVEGGYYVYPAMGTHPSMYGTGVWMPTTQAWSPVVYQPAPVQPHELTLAERLALPGWLLGKGSQGTSRPSDLRPAVKMSDRLRMQRFGLAAVP